MSEPRWQRFLYRAQKVYVRVDPRGRPAVDARGLATIRYRPDDNREYSVRPRDLQPLTPELEERLARRSARRRRRSSAIHVYTDGGAGPNPGPAGCGIVLEADGYRREVALWLGRATNNVAELTAVREALRRIKDRRRPVRLHLDSAYALGVLSGAWKAEANRELIDDIRRLMAAFADLRLRKVRAHATDALNNLADRLARQAREERRSSERLVEVTS